MTVVPPLLLPPLPPPLLLSSLRRGCSTLPSPPASPLLQLYCAQPPVCADAVGAAGGGGCRVQQRLQTWAQHVCEQEQGRGSTAGSSTSSCYLLLLRHTCRTAETETRAFVMPLQVTIPEKYVLMSEPDHVWLKPMPNLMRGEHPGAMRTGGMPRGGAGGRAAGDVVAVSPHTPRPVAAPRLASPAAATPQPGPQQPHTPLTVPRLALVPPAPPPPRCSRLPLLLHRALQEGVQPHRGQVCGARDAGGFRGDCPHRERSHHHVVGGHEEGAGGLLGGAACSRGLMGANRPCLGR